MHITNIFLKKSTLVIVAVAGCLQLSSCDSDTNITLNPDANFELGNRYNADTLASNSDEIVEMPRFLSSGDRVSISEFTFFDDDFFFINQEITNDIDEVVNSSGQIFIGDFRFNYNSEFGSNDNEGFIIRSNDHAIENGEDDLVTSLLRLRDTSNGSGSLAEALTADPSRIGDEFISFTDREIQIVTDAIRSLGYIVRDTAPFQILANQFIELEADSTNQLLIDENKITGNVETVRVWRSLLFEYTVDRIVDGEPVVTSPEFKIILGSETQETSFGTFEIQLNSL